MRVVVDTSIWSLAFRRRTSSPSPQSLLLAEVIRDGRAVLLGVVRQELLSGIKHLEQFDRLLSQLKAFPDVPVEISDYEVAASYFNTCMASGIQGRSIDFLICACASRRDCPILTADPDFDHYARVLPITLLRA